ncbi:DNA repair protein XRCC2-like [Apostichopus japonicus]|uniref:DNA repair protein XRCC2-like n=1 Tax=Stichopus japonicus TaxID=307972 RepID=UPI003AB5F4FD
MAGGSETGAQLLARLGSRPSLQGLCPLLFGEEYPKPGGLIEFCGESGTAKTECLLNFAVSCILPPDWNGYALGGVGSGVVFIDTQSQFSMLRAFTLLEKRVTSSISSTDVSPVREGGVVQLDDVASGSTVGQRSGLHSTDQGTRREEHGERPTADEIEGFIRLCLEKLYVIRCYSRHQLLITLHSLENFLANKTNIGIAMIDSWSAFYWMDRASFGDQLSLAENCQKVLTTALKKLLDDHQLVVFLTKNGSFRLTGKQLNRQRGSPISPSVGQASTEAEKLPFSADFGSSELKRLITEQYVFERSEQLSESGDTQIIFKATRTHPKPPKTKHFIISEKGLGAVR